VILTLPLILFGEQLVTLLYGEKYQGTGAFVAILGATSALRFLRLAPTIASMARADNLNQLYSNLWRAASLPLALGVVAAGGTPVQIAACGLVAEVLAALVSVFRLWRQQGVPLRESYGAGIYLITLVALGVGLALCGMADLRIGWAAVVAMGALALALCAAGFMFPEVLRLVSGAIRRSASISAVQPSHT
jgi:O-antigen/teichoic acid export membrane protein